MGYIEIDFSQVEDFNNLSDQGKIIFKETYQLHNSLQGLDYKEEWIPVKVEEYEDYLKVWFKNDKWLHYLSDNTWY